MLSTFLGLLTNLRENPDDRSRWLVLADYLEEHGEDRLACEVRDGDASGLSVPLMLNRPFFLTWPSGMNDVSGTFSSKFVLQSIFPRFEREALERPGIQPYHIRNMIAGPVRLSLEMVATAYGEISRWVADNRDDAAIATALAFSTMQGEQHERSNVPKVPPDVQT